MSSFLQQAKWQYSAILADLGWDESKLEQGEEKPQSPPFSFYSKQSHPNIVEVRLDNPKNSVADRLFQYKQVVDIGMLERLKREIKQLQPSPFEEFTPEDYAKSKTDDNKKTKFLKAQSDYKRRRQKYRGSKLKRTPRQVNTLFQSYLTFK